MPFVGRTGIGAVVGVIGFGLGFGVATIAKPALLADRYDTAAYATIAGDHRRPHDPRQSRRAPSRRGSCTATGGYTPVLVAAAVGCLIAAAGIAAVPSYQPTVAARVPAARGVQRQG